VKAAKADTDAQTVDETFTDLVDSARHDPMVPVSMERVIKLVPPQYQDSLQVWCNRNIHLFREAPTHTHGNDFQEFMASLPDVPEFKLVVLRGYVFRNLDRFLKSTGRDMNIMQAELLKAVFGPDDSGDNEDDTRVDWNPLLCQYIGDTPVIAFPEGHETSRNSGSLSEVCVCVSLCISLYVVC